MKPFHQWRRCSARVPRSAAARTQPVCMCEVWGDEEGEKERSTDSSGADKCTRLAWLSTGLRGNKHSRPSRCSAGGWRRTADCVFSAAGVRETKVSVIPFHFYKTRVRWGCRSLSGVCGGDGTTWMRRGCKQNRYPPVFPSPGGQRVLQRLRVVSSGSNPCVMVKRTFRKRWRVCSIDSRW